MATAGPTLGRHSRATLEGGGFGHGEIDKLIARGIVREAAP